MNISPFFHISPSGPGLLEPLFTTWWTKKVNAPRETRVSCLGWKDTPPSHAKRRPTTVHKTPESCLLGSISESGQTGPVHTDQSAQPTRKITKAFWFNLVYIFSCFISYFISSISFLFNTVFHQFTSQRQHLNKYVRKLISIILRAITQKYSQEQTI